MNSDGSVTVVGVGTWQVDLVSGIVKYIPENGFVGTASISYTVADNDGLRSEPANITVDVDTETVPVEEELAFTGTSFIFDLTLLGLMTIVLGFVLQVFQRKDVQQF